METPGLQSVPPAQTPRTLWVELTSRCPLDCVFCSRKSRRGAGEHLPFALFEHVVDNIRDPRRFVLNYSGESTVYPELIAAIRLARSSGAYVELVSALTPAAEPLVAQLARSGLHRLSVSVHAAESDAYREIYRYGEFDSQRARLERLVEECRGAESPPVVDLSFVAMDRNLRQMPGVVALAERLGLEHLVVFPVMRRDEIPEQFLVELGPGGARRPAFDARVQSTVAAVRLSHPGVRITLGNPPVAATHPVLGEVPSPCPGPLPRGARIHSCEQNPWETAHVLSNGDVVACEVLDRVPLGNLHHEPLQQIWHGVAYAEFRRRYRLGEVPECRACPWKRAYFPVPLSAEVLGERGVSAQLVHGWHEPDAEPHIWSSQSAAAIVAPRPGARTLHIGGVLPPGPRGSPNALTIACNGTELGFISNTTDEPINFGVELAVPSAARAAWSIEFRTTHLYRPASRGAGGDQRDLGFALRLLAAKRNPVAPDSKRRAGLGRLHRRIRWLDRIGRTIGPRLAPACPHPYHPGISVIIPELSNAEELAQTLESVRGAGAEFVEPVESVVVVNGSPAADYAQLRRDFPAAQWLFFARALGFGGAVAAGLRHARFDWVYLLNNDAELDAHALREAAACRHALTFAIGSQIFLKDPTRFRDETNWTTLFLERGLATIHDWIPDSGSVVDSFYAGGGASLFQARLLRRVLDARAYHPFYWEDAEWGWRARKLGYRTVFCPASSVRHRRRATIGKLYSADVIDSVIERNRLLFHLRNLTSPAALEPAMQAIAAAPEPVAGWLLSGRAAAQIGAGRLWNHLAPVDEAEVLDGWGPAFNQAKMAD